MTIVQGDTKLVEIQHTTSLILPDPLPSERFASALSFWHEVRGEQRLPLTSAINPTKIPKKILPSIAVVSVEHASKQLRIRVVGEAIKDAMAHNPTNAVAEDIEGGEDVSSAYKQCITARSLLYCEGPTRWSVHDYKIYRALLMPFAAPDGQIGRILTYLEFLISPL